MQNLTVKVIKSFYFQGKATKVGDVIPLPRVFALEMMAANKALKAPEKPVKPKEPEKAPEKSESKGAKNAK